MNPIAQIVQICLPVFALIGVGKLLQRKHVIRQEHLPMINSILYNVALPALVFSAVVVQPCASLLNPVLIVGTVVPTLVIAAIFLLVTRVAGLRGDTAAVCTFEAYWANIAYIGFPLAKNAFGAEQGLAKAAIVNAFTMPVFIALSMVLVGLLGTDRKRSTGRSIRVALTNPVVGAAVLAFLIAAVRDFSGLASISSPAVTAINWIGSLVLGFTTLLGTLGLPLALLSVGASISLGPIREHTLAIALALAGKMLLMPFLTVVTVKLLFPGADRVSTGVAILLMATPNAVSSYVISSRMGIQPQLVGAIVAISTAVGIITVPVWLYVALYW